MAKAPETGLASLSLTHVHYDPTDPISYLCAWLALLPQALCLTYVTLIYTTREVEIMLMFAGQISCEALNWILKRVFKEARPDRVRHLGKGYGMPSSHAQFVAFFAVSVVLFLFLRHAPSAPAFVRVPGDEAFGGFGTRGDGGVSSGNGNSNTNGNGSVGARAGTEGSTSAAATVAGSTGPLDLDSLNEYEISTIYKLQLHYPRTTHALLSLAFLGLAGAVAVSRIYLSYHTPRQVLVGCAAGAAYAVLWFIVTEYVRRTGWVEWVLEWRLLRSARIRDLICQDDLIEIGWQLWEEKRRIRRLAKLRKGS